MTTTSRAPIVRARLTELLRAWLPADVAVTYSLAEGGLRARKHVTTLGATAISQEWAPLGARARDEAFSLGVEIVCGEPGATCQKAYESAYAILAVIEHELVATPAAVHLGITATYVEVTMRAVEESEQPTEEGWIVTLTVALAVHARI